MTKLKILGAVCLSLALAGATPALARGMGHAPMGHGAGVAHFAAPGGGGPHFAGGGYRHGGGWGPGIAAGVVAGAALGAAGAYGYDSYAYDPGPDYYDQGYYDQGPVVDGTYANPNGFVCQPGTWFRGTDGRNHLCQ